MPPMRSKAPYGHAIGSRRDEHPAHVPSSCAASLAMPSRRRKATITGKPRRPLYLVEIWETAPQPHWRHLRSFRDRVEAEAFAATLEGVKVRISEAG